MPPASEYRKQPHVVVFPWPEQGHINPAMAIARHLLASGIFVTFVHTQRNYALVQEAASAHPSDQVPAHNKMKVEVVPDVDGYVLNPAATQQGLDLLLSNLMQRHPPPSCLLVDTFLPWSHPLAARHGIPHIEFFTASACAYSIGVHIPDLIARGYLPITDPGCMDKVVDFIPGLTSFRMVDVPMMLAISDLNDPEFKFFASVVTHSKDADRMLVHTVYDVEYAVVNALRETAGIRMDPIGPLVTDNRHSLLQEDLAGISWLDKQKKDSVLYIAFGSVFFPKSEDLVELAYGLAASGQPFFWVIRPNQDASEKQLVDKELEEGLDLLKKQGKGYITSWAPQPAVLGHPSVGAFLSHCGWNSTMESLYLGVPILGFPLGGEQPTNLKCIVDDWKAGLALQDGKNRGELLRRDHVEMAVMEMLTGEGGKRARGRALEWSRHAHNAQLGSSKNNLQKLVDDIKQGQLKISTN